MGVSGPLRRLYIKSTDLTRGYQGKDEKLAGFYRAWSRFYDFSVSIDPAFSRELKAMVRMTVRKGDATLDVGCGTGMSTLHAAEIADKVVGIDLSADMTRVLRKKLRQKGLENVEVITGRFPEALPRGAGFDSVISSFAIVHFPPGQRAGVYRRIFGLLSGGGRLGLFSARGELASSFETKKEMVGNLERAGFRNIETKDVSDIYRIATAEVP